MRTYTLASALVLIATASTASAGIFGGCDNTAPRSANVSAAGATRVVVIGRAGSLHVTGRRGAGEVRATGTACASDRESLDRIKLTGTRNGSEVRIEVEIPDWSGIGWHETALDLEVTVPAEVALVVEDGSGDTKIENTGSLEVSDGSGDLDIRGVSGNLRVRDGSGDLTIRDVTGEVTITDGSGDIDLNGAAAVTVLADGSGGLDVRNVRRNVVVESKGSGELHVADVGGDFRVLHKGSGDIDYERVAGKVDLPRKWKED
jgi:hypothetical protein